ncbi:MAG: hypothetical protein WBM14_00140 [Terracidiphilus sp.]|jgi:hypothetical protein
MTSLAISGTTPPTVAQAAPASKTASVQAETTVKAPVVLKADTVKLSLAAQAKLMHRQGQSLTLIAAALGTDVKSVDGYLGIKVAVQVSATPEAASPGQAAPAATNAPDAETRPSATTGQAAATEPSKTPAKS